MESEKIIKLSKKNIKFEPLEKAKKILEKNYNISYGYYDEEELKKAIHNEKPFFVDGNFIIGYENKKFINDEKNKINIDKMVKAIIIEDEIEMSEPDKPGKDLFAIIKETQWDILSFRNIFDNLYVGEMFLPPHSAVFSFLNPTEETKNKKIASMLSGININIYNQENYIDNCFHEIGHLFWRDSVSFEEKKKFNEFFKNLKPSAIYDYEWERHNVEEVFCTVYKWYLKSILINRSFYNILEFEEPMGLELLEDIFARIKRDKMVSDMFEINKKYIDNFLNPKVDALTGRKYVDVASMEKAKNIQVPDNLLNKIVRFENGVEYIEIDKKEVPVKNKGIDFELLKKAKDSPYSEKPLLYMDMDGVVADFKAGYKELFNRDAEKDDPFTVNQFCQAVPDFFLRLPVNHKGFELFDLLKDKYKIVFLTTPMAGMPLCRRNKIEWVKRIFGDVDVIFSSNKAAYVVDEKSILIDDMQYNLKPWSDAGGTGINFNKHRNDKIIDLIDDVFDDRKHIEKVKSQLSEMEVELEPTEKQKESGNYKKGDIVFKSMNIKIENPKGSIRWGINSDNKKWFMKMKCHYGYIVNGQDGVDGDKVDVFLGDKLNSSRAFIVNQFVNGIFDEHKIVLGVETIEDAEKLYLSNYKKGWNGLGSIYQTNTKKLREWLKDGNMQNPYTNNN